MVQNSTQIESFNYLMLYSNKISEIKKIINYTNS